VNLRRGENYGQTGMAEFRFEPPLRLAGTPKVMISSLDEAADYVRAYTGARRPMSQDGVLRRLEGAGTAEQERDAADAFRGWAESEGLLIEPEVKQ
jgi:hypothetical protein